uniref:Uncharacterized protein n=1 Tax=Anopheles dirus TaxID=7168 RepID=A0A182NW18_9DIPT
KCSETWLGLAIPWPWPSVLNAPGPVPILVSSTGSGQVVKPAALARKNLLQNNDPKTIASERERTSPCASE